MATDQYDLIIFDCDGTLVSSHDMNHSIMAQVANEYGDLGYTMELVEQEYLGVAYNKFFKIIAQKHGIEIPEETATERCIELAFQKIPAMVQEVMGVFDMLEKIQQHYSITVVSNANKSIVIRSLQALKLDQFFEEDKIVAGHEMATPKPAPDLFLLAAEKMDVEPSRCLVIEDSSTGVTAGVAAGMEVWGFTGVAHDKKHAESHLKQAGATHVFNDFIHMEERLKL